MKRLLAVLLVLSLLLVCAAPVYAEEPTFDFSFTVTDRNNNPEPLQVEFGSLATYSGDYAVMKPTLKIGSMELVEGDHYDLESDWVINGNRGQVTVKGKDIIEGYEKTFYYPVVKRDISNASVSARDVQFTGMPVESLVSVHCGTQLNEGVDYLVFYENNVNIGTATARVVGIGNCYGEVTTTFQIKADARQVALAGNYIGNASGELSEDYLIEEGILLPGAVNFNINTEELHMAAYMLYRVEEETVALIDEKVSDVGYWPDTMYSYDFTSVYEDAADVGGEVYMLSYSWIGTDESVYAGVLIFAIPAKVLDATSMTMEHAENDGDFRKEYLNLSGDDGVLGPTTWTSSDPAVATVENGVVTLQKPGTATIVGQSGELSQAYEVTADALNITEGIIFDYSEQTEAARVIYGERLLTEGLDYDLSVNRTESGVTVTVTGRGLFVGELEKVFQGDDSLADPHTHGFDNSCDGTCNSCEYTRSNDHSFSQTWNKNETHHWHVCTACGEQADLAQHELSSEDETVCQICGPIYTVGDLNGDDAVNEDDAIYLLQHVLLPEFFPVAQDADYTGDGLLNEDDAIYLLQHVLLPDYFPL